MRRMRAVDRKILMVCTRERAAACALPRVQKVDISTSTALTDLIFGVASVAWIQAIHATPKMRSVRAVEVDISTFCTRQVHAHAIRPASDLQTRAYQHDDRAKGPGHIDAMNKH